MLVMLLKLGRTAVAGQAYCLRPPIKGIWSKTTQLMKKLYEKLSCDWFHEGLRVNCLSPELIPWERADYLILSRYRSQPIYKLI